MREIKVLDPACDSGNFLYVSLQLLMSLEKEVITHELFDGLTLALPEVHPRQMYGIEINPIAHDLASIVVWIGYIQWRQSNGYATLTRREPILETLSGNIRQMDAIMQTPPPWPTGSDTLPVYGEGEQEGGVSEPDWPAVDVIVGNPPFLGGKKMRGELSDYVDNLFTLYAGRVPPEADLVCYWFEKARAHIAAGKAKRAGLLATNSIRGGANRDVLKRIKESGDIFMAWSDREWVLDGAAVRVSMIGFDQGVETEKSLDGVTVATINPDLTTSDDLTKAIRLKEMFDLAYMGVTPAGPFDISGEEARKMLAASNLSLRTNFDVVRPYYNAMDITRGSRDVWTIDFGTEMTEQQAAEYELPFQHVRTHVYRVRQENNRESYKKYWWLYAESRPAMRAAVKPLSRYIATPMVAKHRIFVWLDNKVVPANLINVIARDDDYFFGVLHSRLHEVWSLRMGTWLGVGNDPRYTPTTTFETFPFPWPPGHEDTTQAAYQAISAAAQQLDAERAGWLNPTPPPLPPVALPEFKEGEQIREHLSERGLKDRTLTKLYNALHDVRKTGVPSEPGDFAPRLDDLHRALDQAVCDAYGWPHDILDDEEALLGRLLALNLARAG